MKDTAKYILVIPILEAIKRLTEDFDILGLQFSEDNISTAKEELKKVLLLTDKPIMLKGTGKSDIDKTLLPELTELLDRESIIAYASESNYREIIPSIIKGNHKLVIRTPIDINLAKEMNILAIDSGLKENQIIIDPDIGGLGYGLEYGYSIIEKIKLEGQSNDKYLNFPIISFATEETAKTKEAKDESMKMFLEIASASAVKAAGADYIVFNYEEAIKTMRNLIINNKEN